MGTRRTTPEIQTGTVTSGARTYGIVSCLADEQLRVRDGPHLRAPDLPGLWG